MKIIKWSPNIMEVTKICRLHYIERNLMITELHYLWGLCCISVSRAKWCTGAHESTNVASVLISLKQLHLRIALRNCFDKFILIVEIKGFVCFYKGIFQLYWSYKNLSFWLEKQKSVINRPSHLVSETEKYKSGLETSYLPW